MRILVADDDLDNRTILEMALRRAGHEVIEAKNGEEALSQTALERPDLIFLDMSMPKMDGWTVTQKLRENPELCRTFIVAFTAHAMQGDLQKTMAVGCDAYVSKPCRPSEVVRQIEAWTKEVNNRKNAAPPQRSLEE